ncbi:MAG TPA: DUF4279 domain-containing protein [Nonomuraea sp.]|nr:DUF4279 domain-containing protein [Nonomuraea sp.]
MRVRQYVYFAVKSETLDAMAMATRIGLAPDEIAVRGSHHADPPRPVVHVWKVVCRDRGIAVDEQIARLVERLTPYTEAIGALAEELNRGEGCSTVALQVVRILDTEDGEDEDLTSPNPEFVRLAGQHQLLGWHLDRRTMQFLISTHAELDVDEYG